MKTKQIKLFVVLMSLLAVLVSSSALASGDKGNGGDEIGVEFTQSFITAVDFMKKDGTLSDENAEDFKKFLESVSVLVVDEELEVELAGIPQKAVAVNFIQSMSIKINRERWKHIESPYIKEAIAFHEVLSLKGLEKTGQYRYSARYLAARKLNADVLVGGGSILKTDFILDALRASPEYLQALLFLTRTNVFLENKKVVPTFSTTLSQIENTCYLTDGQTCIDGVNFYKTQVDIHFYVDDKPHHSVAGFVSGSVRYFRLRSGEIRILPAKISYSSRFDFYASED